MTTLLPDLVNVQANILHGSSLWREARYVFFTITDRGGAADFVDALRASPRLGNATYTEGAMAEANINVAFTHQGLAMMEATIDDTARFLRRPTLRSMTDCEDAADDGDRSAFEAGMRCANIGDRWPENEIGSYQWPQDGSDATAWWSDDPDTLWAPATDWPHILVWISATTPEVCATVYCEIQNMAAVSGGILEIGFQNANVLAEYREHFGFVDGISQPAIEGVRQGNPGDGKLGARGWEGLKVGEFILGYPNEACEQPGDTLPDDLARDGTFLVYRKLCQDVKAFRKAASDMFGDDSEIAEAMMGRKCNGNPLLVPPGAPAVPDDESLRNDFTYAGDRRGLQCPLGSHVRRANPRDDLHFEGRRVNNHRIIRRGMPYGKPYDEDPGGKRGLIFIAFNARIEDQFEFIQKQWLNRGTTFRLGDDADPIAGVGTDIRIVINGDTPVLHKVDLPFTQFLGGDYFFVPSIPALEEIAFRARSLPSDPTPTE